MFFEVYENEQRVATGWQLLSATSALDAARWWSYNLIQTWDIDTARSTLHVMVVSAGMSWRFRVRVDLDWTAEMGLDAAVTDIELQGMHAHPEGSSLQLVRVNRGPAAAWGECGACVYAKELPQARTRRVCGLYGEDLVQGPNGPLRTRTCTDRELP